MTDWLEHRIPPPVVGVITAALMWWGAANLPGPAESDSRFRLAVVAVLVVAGLSFDLAGLLSFRASRTTINPLRPERASSLVTSGVYRITRNPMYVGMACLLLAWAVYLAHWPVFLGPVAYMLYLNQFQIRPEERVLLKLFGDEYRAYAKRVRRWL